MNPFRPRHASWGAGFTLVELLVVIAIIALLVALLAPSLQNAKALGRRAVCASRQFDLGAAFAAYWQNNHFRNPQYRQGAWDDPGYYWPWAVRPYLGLNAPDDLDDPARNDLARRSENFNCPSAIGTGVWQQPDEGQYWPHAGPIYFGQEYGVGVCSIGLNYFISYHDPWHMDYRYEGSFRYPRMDTVDPGKVGLLMDSGRAMVAVGTNATIWQGYHWGGCQSYDLRHLGALAMTYADGRVVITGWDYFWPAESRLFEAWAWPDLMD